MYTKTITLALALLIATPAAVPVIASNPTITTPETNDDRNAIILANLKMAKAFLEDGDYIHAKEKAMRVLDVAPNHPEALDIIEICNLQEARQRRVEEEDFNNACSEGTVDALQRFINQYPNSSFVTDAQARINDHNMWQQAKQANTIEAYERYISTSDVKAYRNDAQMAINSLRAKYEWEQLASSSSITDIEDFRSRYPNSAYDADAQERLNLLHAEHCFRTNQHEQAIVYYEAAKSRHPLTGDYLAHYDELMLEREFETLKTSDDANALEAFLNKIPVHHTYHDPIANQLAITLAQQLNQYSTDSDYSRALGYATNPYTRQQVNTRIDRAKKERSRYRRQQHSAAHQLWWERNLKFGWHMFSAEFWKHTTSLRSGLRLKLGTHQDVFNISVGADYVYHAYTSTYSNSSGNSDWSFRPICHQVAFPLNIKFNFTNGDNKCSFYIGCAGEYGLTFATASDYEDLCNDHTLAIEPQIGFNWKHADLGFFWRKYMKDNGLLKSEYSYGDVLDDISKDQRAGMYLTIYF